MSLYSSLYGKTTYPLKTLTALRESFWDAFPEFQPYYKPRKRQDAYNATIRTAWCMYVDSMGKDNQISPALANRATL